MLLKLIPEFESLAQDAIIDDDFEKGRYYSYLLVKVYHDLLYLNSEKKEEYKTKQFEHFLNYIGIEIIDLHHRFQNDLIIISNIQKAIDQIISKINCFDLEVIIKKRDSEDYLELFYDELRESNYKMPSKLNILHTMQEKIASIEGVELNRLGFYLYQVSMLEYFSASTYFLLLEGYTYKILISQKDSHSLQKTIKSPPPTLSELYKKMLTHAYRSIKYDPDNCLIYKLLSKILIPPDSVNLNNAYFYLNNYSYLNEGAKYNRENRFEEADKIYHKGLFYSRWGERSNILYNIALNLQNYAEHLNPENPIKEYLDLSISYTKRAIFDLKISIDQAFFSQDSYALFLPILKYYRPSLPDGYEELTRISMFLENFLKTIPSNESCHYIFTSYNMIGLNYRLKNDFDAALQYYTKGIEYFFLLKHDMDSHDLYDITKYIGDLFNNRGLLYLKYLKDYNNALSDFRYALEYKAEDSDGVILNKTACFLELGKYSSVIHFAESVISEIKTESVRADIIFNEILASYHLSNISMIEQLYEQYSNIEPVDGKMLDILGQAYQSTGDINKAIEFYEKAEKKGKISASYHLGQIRKNEKREEHIQNYINKSIEDIKRISRGRVIENMPELFTYKPINKYTLQSLIDEYIYFADIFSLNDPFDCRMIQEYSNDPVYRKVFNIIGEPRMFCMSKTFDNDLLWSHYSNQHRGICTSYSFDYNKLLDYDIHIFDVKYEESLSEYKNNLLKSRIADGQNTNKMSLKEDMSLLNDIILKKNIWSYENEVRLFNFGIDKKYNINNFYKIDNITFGCLTPDEDIKTVVNIMKKLDNNVDLDRNLIVSEKGGINFDKMKKSEEDIFKLVKDEIFSIEKYL